MTLAQLQALAAVVELGSLTAAADRLSRSQSAISHALTELEDLTEVKLLWRDRQPVVLTAAGERLWPYVQNVVREVQLLRQQFSLSRGKLEGKLVVASLPSVSLAFVVPALEALKDMHQGVSAVLLEGTDSEVEGWIDDGTADIGVVAGTKTFAHNLPLLDEDFVAVAADGMFAGRKRVSAKQLSTAPFIFSKAGCGPVIADYFARGGCRCRPRSTWSRCAPFCRWPRPAWACRSCRASRSRTRRSAAAYWSCRRGCIARCGCRGIRPATRSQTSSCGSSTRNARRRRRRSTRARERPGNERLQR